MNGVFDNAIKDPTYRPYCLGCTTMTRMRLIERMLWTCDSCGAIHDERGSTSEECELDGPNWSIVTSTQVLAFGGTYQASLDALRASGIDGTVVTNAVAARQMTEPTVPSHKAI